MWYLLSLQPSEQAAYVSQGVELVLYKRFIAHSALFYDALTANQRQSFDHRQGPINSLSG